MIEVTLRKRSRWSGQIVRWEERLRSFDEVLRMEGQLRKEFARRARFELLVPRGVSPATIHALRTCAGMNAAAAAGKVIGRPRKVLNPGRARGVLAGWTAVHGRMAGLAAAAGELGVSVATLRRAEKGWRA